MIEKDAMLTTVGVVLLAISYGISLSYIDSSVPSRFGYTLPVGMNLAVMIYISYGLFTVSKLAGEIKMAILIAFVLLYTFEMTIMYEKPTTWYGVPTSKIFVTIGTLLRLYLIISLHNDLPKTFFVTAAKAVVEPVKVEQRPEGNWDKAYGLFENTMKRIPDLSADDRLELINRFRAARGQPPKDVVLKGGQR